MAESGDALVQGSHVPCGTCFLRAPVPVCWVGDSLSPHSSPDLFCLFPVLGLRGVVGVCPLHKVGAFW